MIFDLPLQCGEDVRAGQPFSDPARASICYS